MLSNGAPRSANIRFIPAGKVARMSSWTSAVDPGGTCVRSSDHWPGASIVHASPVTAQTLG